VLIITRVCWVVDRSGQARDLVGDFLVRLVALEIGTPVVPLVCSFDRGLGHREEGGISLDKDGLPARRDGCNPERSPTGEWVKDGSPRRDEDPNKLGNQMDGLGRWVATTISDNRNQEELVASFIH